MLGDGWSPDVTGGLNRYFRDLFEAPEPDMDRIAVVQSPATDSPRNVAVASTPDAPLARRVLAYFRSVRSVARGVDVVDSHFALYGLLPLLLSRRSQLRVVHFHGPWAAESESQGVGGRLSRAFKRAIERSCYGRADVVVVLSQAFRQLIVREYSVDSGRVHVIPPGVDLDRFTPGNPGTRSEAREALGLPANAWIAMSTRRLVPRMGLENLIDAWAALVGSKTAVASTPVLVVAGEGPSRESLERRADRLGLQERVRFAGRISDEALVDLYRAADVSVIPTVALEGFGLVALESLACGTPVVASRVGGLPDALAGMRDDVLVPPGDVESLSRRLAAAADRSLPLPSLDQCREHAERFSWSAAASAHRRAYADAIRDLQTPEASPHSA